MATAHTVATVAMSFHNAIAVNDKPLTIEEGTEWLRRYWEEPDLEVQEVKEAAEELLRRGRLSKNGDTYDTLKRNALGRRCMQSARDKDPNSPNFGWF